MNNNDKSSRQFQGVWIPKEIWLDNDLSINEKVILTEIDSFSTSEGCFASNKHFGEFMDLSPNRCSSIISKLEIKGKITIRYVYQPGTKKIARRYLKTVKKYDNRPSVSGSTPSISGNAPSENGKTPSGNAKGTNTSDTNTSDTNTKEIEEIPFFEIINYLNLKTGKDFKNAKGHQDCIKARWNEGYRLSDFKKVVDNKTHSWKGDATADGWLRPRTLFGPKFDDYLNETIINNAPSIKNGIVKSEVKMPIYTKVDVSAEDPDELEKLRKEFEEALRGSDEE